MSIRRALLAIAIVLALASPALAQQMTRTEVHADPDHRRVVDHVAGVGELAGEHRLYPLVIRWFAEGRVSMQDDRLQLDGNSLESPLRFTPEDLPAT